MDQAALINELLQKMTEQQAMMSQLLKQVASTAAGTSSESLFDRFLKRIDKFAYDPDQDDCFDLWYRRYDYVFTHDCASLDEPTKTRLLVSALDGPSHARFSRHILPKKPSDLGWDTTLETLSTLFGNKKSLFRRRFECLKMTFSPNDDITNFINRLKARSQDAQLKDIKQDTLECLALVFAFQAPELAEYRVRFLRKLEEDDTTTIDDLAKEYHIWKSAKDDSQAVEAASNHRPFGIQAVHQRSQKKTDSSCPPSPCPICSGDHWKRQCPKLSRSQKKLNNVSHTSDARSINVQVGISGTPTELQLDTGASVTLISLETWNKIERPSLEPCSHSLHTVDGSPLANHERFMTDFVIQNNDGHSNRGYGWCYVSDHSDLLGLPWIKQMPGFSNLFKKISVSKTPKAVNSLAVHSLSTTRRRNFDMMTAFDVPFHKKKLPRSPSSSGYATPIDASDAEADAPNSAVLTTPAGSTTPDVPQRPKRQRHPPVHLQIDPHRVSYRDQTINLRGEVLGPRPLVF